MMKPSLGKEIIVWVIFVFLPISLKDETVALMAGYLSTMSRIGNVILKITFSTFKRSLSMDANCFSISNRQGASVLILKYTVFRTMHTFTTRMITGHLSTPLEHLQMRI